MKSWTNYIEQGKVGMAIVDQCMDIIDLDL